MVPPGGGIKKPAPPGGQEQKPDPLSASVPPPAVHSKPRASSYGSDKPDSVETSGERKPVTGGIGKLKVTNGLSPLKGVINVPKVRCPTFGGRSFSYMAPTLWNALPLSIRSAPELDTFKSKLKTHLFCQHFNV